MALFKSQIQFSFEDTDGDLIEFRMGAAGRLQLFVNGELELAHVRKLSYQKDHALIQDETGDFNFRPDDHVKKAAVLRTLAAQIGVVWNGDEPTPVNELHIVDTDGDLVDFRLSATGKLEELVNGSLEIADVQELTFSSKDGTVYDGSGELQLKSQDRLENAVLLQELAFRAGVSWRGDEPLPVKAASKFNRRLVLQTPRPAKFIGRVMFRDPKELYERRRTSGLSESEDGSKRIRVAMPETSAPSTETFNMDECDSERSWEMVSQGGSSESWELLSKADPTEFYDISDGEEEEYAMA